MSDALDEIVDLFERRMTREVTVSPQSLRAHKRNWRYRRELAKPHPDYERRPVSLPRVRWLERPDP